MHCVVLVHTCCSIGSLSALIMYWYLKLLQMSISRYQTIYIKLSKVNYNDFYLHRITDSVVYFDHFLKAWNLLR
jgi:hypothetical protein